MNKETKESLKLIIVALITISLCGAFFWMMLNSIVKDNEKLNVCANEYGFEEITKYAGGQFYLPFQTEKFNETHFVCCLKQVSIGDGVLKNLNCTSINSLEVIGEYDE